MEGNSITAFENLCRIFEMRIKLDREKGVKISLDVLDNYEKYSKKIFKRCYIVSFHNISH